MMMVDAVEVYQMYNAIRLHFTSKSYDCIKYNMKSHATPESYWKRRDKGFFARLARKLRTADNVKGYLVANFLADNTWIGDMDDDVFREWEARQESLTYTFESDVRQLSEHPLKEILVSVDGNVPSIVQDMIAIEVSIETVVIIDAITDFIRKNDDRITDTLLWPEVKLKLQKYRSFMDLSPTRLQKFAEIMRKHFTS